MGAHETSHRRRKRSIADTLVEAEHEHYLDCPNADIPIRSACILLDVILFSLASSGIHHLVETLKNSLPVLIGTLSQPAEPLLILGLSYAAWLLKTLALFMYFVWCTLRFGGSPAKLLMGLRVVDADTGERLDYVRALLRETLGKGLFGLLLINPITSLIRSDRRGLHDLMSRSVVKKVRGGM